MWALAQIEAKKQLQDKALLFWTLLLPIAFIIVFVAIFASNVPDQAAVISQIVPGFTVFFSVFIIISMVISFVKDRDRGMVARLASTPLTAGGYFFGKWLPFLGIVIGQIAVLTLMGVIVYDMPLDRPFIFTVIAICLAVMITAWGVTIAVFSKTENTGMVITQIIAMAGAILGGLWMPYEILPEVIQVIGKFLPQYWAHQGLMDAISQAGGENVWLVLLILIGYAVAGFAFAFTGYRRFLRTARS